MSPMNVLIKKEILLSYCPFYLRVEKRAYILQFSGYADGEIICILLKFCNFYSTLISFLFDLNLISYPT